MSVIYLGGSICSSYNGELVIQKSIFYNNSAGSEGGTLFLEKNASLTVIDTLFRSNKAYSGATIIAAWNVTIFADNCRFVENMAFQGVIYVTSNVTMHIKNTTIQNNHAKKTVIVQGKNHTSIHLERSLLEENFGDGTILVEDNSSLQFSYCQVRNNVATSYVLSTVKSTLSMTHSTFSDNLQASVFQGISSEINIDWCTFTNNSAMTLGAVGRIQYPSKVRVYHSTFIQNHANEKGGALVSYGGSLELHHSPFIENFAGSKGGAIYLSIDKTKFKAVNVSFIRNRAGMDGAAVHIHTNVDTIFERCTFLNNSAPEGTSLPLSRTYVIKTQHNNNAMLIPNLTR